MQPSVDILLEIQSEQNASNILLKIVLIKGDRIVYQDVKIPFPNEPTPRTEPNYLLPYNRRLSIDWLELETDH
jgi:hypothetical protein